MSNLRTKNAFRNMRWGLLKIIVIQLLPFVIRTVMINTLGVEYLGLNSIFTSIISMLHLGELGFGSAFLYALYKPIAEENHEEVCRLLSFYRKIYRIIGTVIFLIGLTLVPFLHIIISKDCPPDVNLYVLYLIILGDTAASYLFAAYKQSLLLAHQRADIESKISILLNAFLYTLQILLLVVFKNYYIYIVTKPLFTLLNNIIIATVTKRLYPQYVCRGDISKETKKEMFSKVTALAGHKIGTTVISSSGSMVISAYLGLTVAAIHSNYYTIMYAVIKVMSMLISSTIAGVGNSLITRTKEKNFELFSVINFGIVALVTISSACFLNLYQPFMTWWMGEEMLMPWNSVILMVVYYYTWQVRIGVTLFKDAAGLWQADRWKPYVTAVVSLVLNIALVSRIGLDGVFISTIVCMALINAPWETYALFKNVFRMKTGKFYLKKVYEYLVAIAVCVVSYWACGIVTVENLLLEIALKACVCAVSAVTVFVALTFWTQEFKGCVKMAKDILHIK